MRLSKQLLEAMKRDRSFQGEYFENVSLDTLYPNVSKFQKELERLENSPTMINYDRWELDRPAGLHSVNTSIDFTNKQGK